MAGPRLRRHPLAALLTSAVLLAAAGCAVGTDDPKPSSSPTPVASAKPAAPVVPPNPPTPPAAQPAPPAAQLAPPPAPAVVLPARSPEEAAVEASRAVFGSAPVVVLAAADDAAGQLTAASAAVALAVPELLTRGSDGAPAASTPDPVGAELTRLRPRAVLVVGAAATDAVPAGASVVRVAAGADGDELAAATGVRFGEIVRVDAAGGPAAVRALRGPVPAVLVGPAPPRPSVPASPSALPPALLTVPSGRLPDTSRPAPPAGTAAVVGVGVAPVAALATLRAAGLPVLDAPGGDPRATTTAVRAFAAAAPTHVVALGAAFGDPERLAQRVQTARTGVLAPGGGQLVFPTDGPGKRYVALYGTPGTAGLGVLGEQGVAATVARARRTAATYRTLTHDTVVPALEIIATIASAGPGPDGGYSKERTVAELRPLVEAAGDAGMAVVLDLQPGRDDFLDQAKRYQALLELPYVSLAVDPEWRLAPDQLPLHQIGSVDAAEVNAVVAWLADLTARGALPQKMLVVHQFRSSMVTHRARLDVSRDDVAVVIHVDGQGTQPAKAATWRAVRAGAPRVHWGWKNFVDEDHPMLTPRQTSHVRPFPDLVTYQ